MRNFDLAAHSPRARKLHWHSTVGLERARASLESCWRAWCREWGMEATSTTMVNAFEPGVDCEEPRWDSMMEGAWIGAPARSPLSALRLAIFGAYDASPATDGTCQSALDAWQTMLVKAVSHAGAIVPKGGNSPEAGDLHRWSGATRVCFRAYALGRSLELLLHLGRPLSQALCGSLVSRQERRRATPLVPVTDALQRRPLRLRVGLDPLSLTLGELRSLQLGDVLTVPHPLERAFQVDVADGIGEPRLLCQAYLGAVGLRRAVELTSVTHEAPVSSPTQHLHEPQP